MESTYVNQALEYMEYNCNEKLTIADVAAHIGLTRSYFYTIFKAHTHMSPQQYLTKLRITKACELLSYPNSTVTSVANALGYDTSVFYRHFKEIIGYSPSEYKQRAAEGILFEQKDQYLDLQQLQKKKRRSPQAPSHPEE